MKKSIERIKDSIVCTACRQTLRFEENGEATCISCNMQHTLKDEVFFAHLEDQPYQKQESSVFYALKMFFKKSPAVYRVLSYVFGGPTLHTSGRDFIRNIKDKEQKIIVNIGAGNKILPDPVVNLDIYPYVGVSVVADAAMLPLGDNSVDAIVCDNLLEHVKEPQQVVEELYRVLKPGGEIFVGVPFVIHFHSSPHDYTRWTHLGLEQLLQQFDKKEIQVAHGPTSAAMNIVSEWLATLFSFGIDKVYQVLFVFFTAVLSPLKLLDLLIGGYPSSKNAALSFYYIGKKSA